MPRPILRRLAALMAMGLGVVASAHAAGSLTVCTEAAPAGFDMAQHEADVDAVGLTLYDQLLAFKPGTSEVVPGLAERWEISADATQYTFHLRRGVKFHTAPWFKPTREMNADDVMWSFERINDTTHPAHRVAPRGYAYWSAMGMRELIRSIDKLDERTVRIVLTRPEAPFLANLAIPAIASVYSAEYAQQLRAAGRLAQIDTLPVGTGPFVFKSYQKDAVVRYTAHMTYWAGAPKIDRLVFAITPDTAVRAQRIAAGECAFGKVLPESANALQRDGKLAILTNTPLDTSFVALNTEHRFLDERGFREALRLAIDQPGFIRSIHGGGTSRPASSLLPPAMWSHEASGKPQHDPAAARALVAALRYDGRELTMFVSARKADILRAAQVLQADWAGIGVKVKLLQLELGELLERSARGDHDLVLMSWSSDNGDPDNFLTPNLGCDGKIGGTNRTRWCHAPFDRLLLAARTTVQRDERVRLYRAAQRMLADEVPLIPLAHSAKHYAARRELRGVLVTPFDTQDFRAAWLAPTAK